MLHKSQAIKDLLLTYLLLQVVVLVAITALVVVVLVVLFMKPINFFQKAFHIP
jgi:hypothetical protein